MGKTKLAVPYEAPRAKPVVSSQPASQQSYPLTSAKQLAPRKRIHPRLKPAVFSFVDKNYLFLSLGLAAFTLAMVLVSQKRLPPEVPLFYGRAEGEAQLVASWGLVIPSLFSVFVTSANLAIASILKDDFTKKVLVLSALVVALFSVVTTFKIMLLVGSF